MQLRYCTVAPTATSTYSSHSGTVSFETYILVRVIRMCIIKVRCLNVTHRAELRNSLLRNIGNLTKLEGNCAQKYTININYGKCFDWPQRQGTFFSNLNHALTITQ